LTLEKRPSPQLSIIIPAFNNAADLTDTLESLKPIKAALETEILVIDGGSQDDTPQIAQNADILVIESRGPGRGGSLKTGGEAAAGKWFLFLHADTQLQLGWVDQIKEHITLYDDKAGYFKFHLKDQGIKPRLLEKLVALRCFLFKLPYGDQGLLISHKLYKEIGGYKPYPMMEDVVFIRDLKNLKSRTALRPLESKALTSAVRYKDGYMKRIIRNFVCLTLFRLGWSPARIKQIYENKKPS